MESEEPPSDEESPRYEVSEKAPSHKTALLILNVSIISLTMIVVSYPAIILFSTVLFSQLIISYFLA